jgi:uncharacterized protein (TIGR02145 family)
MKFILSIASAIFILISCSTSPNNNGGSTTTVVPVAPSNLTGTVLSSSSVSLSWVDNSTNETGFKIERRVNGTTQFSVVGNVNADVTGFVDTNLTPNTSYEYRVYSFNAVGNSLTYSNAITLTTLSQTSITIPTIITNPLINITDISAISGGYITNNGGANITTSGVVWSISPSPTIALNTKTIDSAVASAFTSNIIGLSANTIYYVRAYATNSVGTAYGSELIFTTITSGGTTNLSSVTICNQVWTSQNLSVSRYRNGDEIPQVTDATQWSSLTTGAWCWYNNDSATYWQYGKLYNWYAVNDSRSLAPQGWHVPNNEEWNKLVKCIDPSADTSCTACTQSAIAGGGMKEVGTTHWSSPNNGATNSSGFIGLPGGKRDYFNVANFQSIGNYGFWWSSTDPNPSGAWYRLVGNYSALVDRSYDNKGIGISVRLVRD